ncbi:hypothetical protein ACS0TY_006719 [Phlomoides rotata]
MEEDVAISRHFFKALIPGFNKKVNLPPGFCKKIKAEKSEWATLRSRRGRWEMGISRNGEGVVSFEAGWPQFVNHHSLKVGDFVLFQHVCGLKFNVLVFDRSCCEKEFGVEPKDDSSRETEKESVISFDTRNPHFITTMQPHHAIATKKTRLNIPIGFVRSNNVVKNTRSAILRNDGGGVWRVNVVVCKGGQFRVYLGKGWCDFYDSNELKTGDVCTFYLNQPRSSAGTILFDVEILPSSV